MLLVETTLKSSPIHGMGLFARTPIAAGTIVWQFHPDIDVVITPAQLETLPAPARAQILHYAYTSKITNNYVLCSDDARFFNHDQHPNTTCSIPEGAAHPEALICVALRDIAIGEELTNDYNEFDAQGMDSSV